MYIREGTLDLTDLLQKLDIIVAGPIGLEFADYFAEFVSEIMAYQFEDSFLPRENSDDVQTVLERLEGIL